MYFRSLFLYICPVTKPIKVMTISEQNHNYFVNMARIAGYWKGLTNVYATELTNENSPFTKQEIGEKLLKAVAVADKWFEHRYEGPFFSEAIEAIMKSEAKPSDIVELERA